jgi:sugar transport protein
MKDGRYRSLLGCAPQANPISLIGSLAATAYIELTGTHRDGLLWVLVVFIAFFAFSQGAVIWVYISEIFPSEVRSRGQGLGAATHGRADRHALSHGGRLLQGLAFVFFAAATVAQLVVVTIFFLETKGLTLEAVESALEHR